MSDYPSDLLYTEEHEYLKSTDEENVYVVGITDYAQGELGDVVYVELPEEGESFAKGDEFGSIEAVKAVAEVYCPVEGKVVAVNKALEDDPELINSDPYGKGWMIRLQVSGPDALSDLMDAESYKEFLGG